MENDKKGIDSLMSEERKFPPPKDLQEMAHVKSLAEYQEMYDRSINNPDGFWLEQAKKMVTWFKEPTVALKYEWNTDKRAIKHTCFEDGELNVAGKTRRDRDIDTARARAHFRDQFPGSRR